jgi:AcrR family transcriptional regulator
LALAGGTNSRGEDSKRADILSAAIGEFSHGYEKASTDAIVKSAGVSKGLLFHYFGSKQELFIATYDYAVNAVLTEFYDLINLNQRDILERWRQITLLKMDLMKKHPKIFALINNAPPPGSDELKQDIVKLTSKLADKLKPKIFDDIDRALFRSDIDAEAAIHIIIFTMEGYAQSQAAPEKSLDDYYGEYGRYLNELEGYIRFFRTNFYRPEERA